MKAHNLISSCNQRNHKPIYKRMAIFSWLMIAALLLAAPGGVAFSAGAGVVAQGDIPGAPQAVTAAFSYTNNVSYNIPDGTSTGNGCVYWPATRYFLVDDYFTVNDLNVELSQSHASRGQIQMKLTAPDGTTKTLMATSGDTYDNYYITIDDASTNALNDGNDDTIGGTRRAVGPSTNGDLDAFTGKDAHGHWTMTICDNTYTGSSPSQLFNAATLVFDGTAYTPLPPQHQQGPPLVETYFVPWPEDQVWTAMGRVFPTSCSNYASFRDNYDAAPRQPMVGFTGITITDANTVVTYDHWEDGYETAITFPSQGSTQVWGDGNLLNGVAPGDADDILSAGQVLVLNDVMLSSTLGTIVDFDARDKITASQPIAVSRSVWADGSQTLFAAADEVYPTDRWGTQFYSPVGDDANLNDMFEVSMVSIIAATDGTLVDIDKDGNGTYETTGIPLNQGQAYFIDDNTDGMDRGGGIRSNSGHPIQVNLMTADQCAGYESRTYPLKPFDLWDYSYYSPVGTPTTNPGAPANDDVPTYVHLYNPGASAINVAYAFATGPETVVNIAANSGANVLMNNGTGAHFYSVIPGTSNNVRDTFTTQSYSNNNGSVNWANNWDETGDDDSASNGDIQVSTTNGLRFQFNTSSALGATIERQSYDMTGYTNATLSFNYSNDGDTDSTDVFRILISNNGGTSWTALGTINANTSGTYNQDITSYMASNTRVRFEIYQQSTSSTSEYFYVDNVDITFQTASSPATDVFYAVASIDADNAGGSGDDQNSTYDWGITLVPEKVMSQYLIVGWAPGDDPTFQGGNTENTAPIWLTGGHPAATPAALGPTPMPNGPQDSFTVCVDYNGDGGPNTDPITGRQYDASTSVAPRSQLKIYKNKLVPPGTGAGTAGDDQTGTQIWVCDGSDAVITAAWGGDPLVSSPSKPGLDMGYTIRNQRAWRAFKDAALQVDKNGNGLFDEGDIIRYTIQVLNTSAVTIPTLTVTDDLPVNVTYVANSTNLTNDGTPPPSSGPIADSGVTLFPLDEGGYAYTNLNAFTSFTITFDATINTGAGEPDGGIITNVAHVSDGTLMLNPDVTLPVQRPLKGAIGNYVWLDEDGDGDQDAGEAGIPNMKVELCADAACTTVLATTYTDADGGYVFPNLNPGTYYVRTTPPAGLNATYDEDGTGTANITMVTVSAGEEHMTADFGYNWNTPGETNGNTGNGAIGDRVWSDADGDGVQDPDEVGLEGVTVNLYSDPDGDGVYDTPAGTTTTDANGNYIFDNLPPGSYVVEVVPPAGYAQTGDPDGTLDNKTTAPIVLSPGDVYVNADFGYTATTAEVGNIGDTLWVDADRDGQVDAGETRLPGVTVSLIQDTNGNGVWDPGEPVIATDTTDANGQYLFSDVPAGAGQDYLVWVNDTDNVLGELVPTYDADGAGTPNISTVQNLTPAGNLNQDFAYAPPGHDAGEGLIGDTVWLDTNNDGNFDPGEGLEGVTVKLYAADGVTLLAVTTPNENGQYFFGDLDPNGTYVVQVQASTLPYSGLTNFVDPDGGNNSTSTVDLSLSGGINLNQDFGYRDQTNPNTISGTIWNDTDADGTLEGGESGRYAGVTVVLKDSDGNIVATTTTDSSGNYTFSGLPDGTYTVDVTDDNNVLNGYWKSTGPSTGFDNNSQVDPYTVTVSGGESNTTADFGYYREPAAISNFIWYDTNKDGIQDLGEPGIIGVEVTLEITYPDGTVVTLTTVTDANGEYSFDNLLLDEDFDGVGTSATPGVGGGDEPAFVVKVTVPSGMEASPSNQGDPTKDSDYAATGVQVYPLQGQLDETIDFGFNPGPTAVTLAAFTAAPDGLQVLVSWETLMEVNVSGFNVYRSTLADGSDRQMLNLVLIPSQFNPGQGGATYEYFDATVQTDVFYYYWLEVMVSGGGSELHGPQSVVIFGTSPRIYLPMLIR